MNLENINQRLNQMLPVGRLSHSKNVAKCAEKLCEIYGCDKEKAYLAGMIHDCAKYLSDKEIEDYVNKYEIYLDPIEDGNRSLSHSVIGAYICEYEFEVEDEDTINAIKYHTTGREDMSLLEKIIYIADLIEEGRKFPVVDTLRELAYGGKLDEALLTSFNNTLMFVINKKEEIHPRTVMARNYLIKEKLL